MVSIYTASKETRPSELFRPYSLSYKGPPPPHPYKVLEGEGGTLVDEGRERGGGVLRDSFRAGDRAL